MEHSFSFADQPCAHKPAKNSAKLVNKLDSQSTCVPCKPRLIIHLLCLLSGSLAIKPFLESNDMAYCSPLSDTKPDLRISMAVIPHAPSAKVVRVDVCLSCHPSFSSMFSDSFKDICLTKITLRNDAVFTKPCTRRPDINPLMRISVRKQRRAVFDKETTQ